MRLDPGRANERVRPRLDRFGELVEVVGHVPEIIEDLVKIFRVRIQRSIQLLGQHIGGCEDSAAA